MPTVRFFSEVPVGGIFRDQNGLLYRRINDKVGYRQPLDPVTRRPACNAILMSDGAASIGVARFTRYWLQEDSRATWPVPVKDELAVRAECVDAINAMLVELGMGEDPPRPEPAVVPAAVPVFTSVA